jgi:hypothetical protein
LACRVTQQLTLDAFFNNHLVIVELCGSCGIGLLPPQRSITCLTRPEIIEELNQTRLVTGGNRVHYLGSAGTPTTDLLTVKLLINSTISMPNAKYMKMGIKDFYLNTPMACYKYMRI